MLISLGSTTLATLRAGDAEVVGARSERTSYQAMIRRPTQVGGGGGGPGVLSPRGADPISLAPVRARPAGRAPAGRGNARSAGRTQLVGRAAHESVVRPSGNRAPLSADRGTPAVSLCPGGALAACGRDRVRRLAV